mgnify:CR=1 FL=1
MKKFTVYNVYLDDGNDVYKIVVPAESEADAVKYCKGNGEVIAVKKNDLVQNIDTTSLADYLRRGGWGRTEVDVIIRVLAMCGLER